MKAFSLVVSAAAVLSLSACGDTDIAGEVTDVTGAPFPGVKVKAGNRPLVTSGPDGKFSVRSVSVPYRLTALSPDGTVAQLFVALTRNDPTILIQQFGGVPAVRRTVVTGHLSTKGPSDHIVVASIVAPPRARAAITAGSLDAQGNYSLTVEWQGESNLSGTLHALQWLGDFSGPQSYDGSARVSVRLSDGKPSSGVDLTLVAVRNTHLAGTLSVAPGYTLLGTLPYVAVSANDSVSVGGDTTGSKPAFDFPAFVGPPLKPGVQAFAQDSSGAIVTANGVARPDGGPLQITLPAAPAVRAPDPQTTVGIGTTFSWSALGGAVYVLQFRAVDRTTAGVALEVVTSGTHFDLPDLSEMGFTWPTAAVFTFSLAAYEPLVPDDVAGGERAAPLDRDSFSAFTGAATFNMAQ